MSDPRHALGQAIEGCVADWLRGAGWTILSRRTRAPSGGEVDIVAIDRKAILVAIEVRARRTARTGSAAESVDRRRVDRLRHTLAAVAPTAPPHAGLRVDLVTAEPIPGVAYRWRVRRTEGIDVA